MTVIPAHLRRLVRRRARNRCEYCRLSQVGQEATFHLDHIRPRARGGKTSSANIAFACVSCSLRKGDRQGGVDPETARRVRLFHPRRDVWEDHFFWDGVRVVGRTSRGRATINVLKLNRLAILAIRLEEAVRNRFPP